MGRPKEHGARSAAALLLSGRAMSSSAVVVKLMAKGYPEGEAREAAEYMAEIGALDDEGYARSRCEIFAAKGWGPARIKNELIARGVGRELAGQAVDEQEFPVEPLVDFARRSLKDRRPGQAELRRVSDALYRRGHSWDMIHTVISEIMNGLDEDDEGDE